MSAASESFAKENQQSLMRALGKVRTALQRHARAGEEAALPEEELNSGSLLGGFCASFALSNFERDLLLLCAGMELDSTFAGLCATAHGDPRKSYPTFGLALAALPEPHWSALLPTSPLRYWRLVGIESGHSLTTAPLRIDERILHHLTSLSYLDERLQGILQPCASDDHDLPPSHARVAQQLTDIWCRPTPPLIELFGEDDSGKRAIAGQASRALRMPLRIMQVADIPTAAGERETIARLWERETILSGGVLLIAAETEEGLSEMKHATLSLVRRLRVPLAITTREPRGSYGRPVLKLEVNRPVLAEQQALWRDAIEPLMPNVNGEIEALAGQFSFSRAGIVAAAAELKAQPPANNDETNHKLWDICRSQARQGFQQLAQRIIPLASWDDIVLPELQRQTLREMASHVRHRLLVYERWGFAGKSSRGLGISALFAGESGTGKTMAAEVLANELQLDLYRIDLSSVVSKYIGETEKNLRRVFDAAEQGGAILLFDEADALFGKRSEVNDSHDRYANIEVSYLLQRMEAYRGLAILTTNRRESLDDAFLRRIRFVVPFPFPDASQRAEIWRRIFPVQTPTEHLDLTKLARLNVAGGNIRNVALNAAFLAADAREPVRMSHLRRAARSEYQKIEKPLTESEIGGWQ